jgi:excisionase family DNA binding protein
MVSREWLSIREASRLLGVHIGTVREWADAGVVPSYRTPGGHRRFSSFDLQTFIQHQRQSPNGHTPTDHVLKQVRDELRSHAPPEWLRLNAQWSEAQRAQQREFGQKLLASVVAYVEEPEQRDLHLDAGRRVAREYGRRLVAGGISAGNAARATIYFRQLILKTVLDAKLGSRTGDEEDAKLFQRVSTFLDEILLALVDVYP